jgi:hypothetical protein
VSGSGAEKFVKALAKVHRLGTACGKVAELLRWSMARGEIPGWVFGSVPRAFVGFSRRFVVVLVDRSSIADAGERRVFLPKFLDFEGVSRASRAARG